MSEIPVRPAPRRLVDWINPTGAKKVHSLIDKVYKRENLVMAWEKVKENRGSGGVDGQNLEAFEAQLDQQLDRLVDSTAVTRMGQPPSGGISPKTEYRKMFFK